jgi:hypothetical protein
MNITHMVIENRSPSDGRPAAISTEIERWHATAARELSRHRPVDGRCVVCGAEWPCVTCRRADVALAAS